MNSNLTTTAVPDTTAPDRVRIGGHAGIYWAALLPAFGLFCWGALSSVRSPGLYMDAVNPDYLVVALLHPRADFAPWILPGNMLFGLFPVMVNIYYGRPT